MDPIAAVFERLDAWRHLPAYQLERRADIFFAAYLPEVLSEFVGHALDPVVIPELPLRRLTGNRSAKVDYALFSADRSRAYFVELKTDMASFRTKQDEYLDEAVGRGLRHVIGGLCDIVRATDARRKYLHLVDQLAALGLIEVPAGLSAAVFGNARADARRARELLTHLRPTGLDLPIEVIFIQPKTDVARRSIDFERFASHAERRTDPFSQRFAESLRRWKSVAGDQAP